MGHADHIAYYAETSAAALLKRADLLTQEVRPPATTPATSSVNAGAKVLGLAAVAATALVIFLAARHSDNSDDADKAGAGYTPSTYSTSHGTYRYTPQPTPSSAASREEPTPTQVTSTAGMPTGCDEALQAIRVHMDLMPPSPITRADFPAIANQYQGMAADLDTAAGKATAADVRSAIRDLASTARRSSVAILTDGATLPSMSDGLDRLSDVCAR